MIQTSDLKTHYTVQPMDYKAIFTEFNKTVHENRFMINLDYLLLGDNFEYVDFSKDVWTLRPEYFCADHYEHSFIYPVVLLANNLKSIFDFTPDNIPDNLIIAPKLNKIIKLLSI